MRRRINNYTIDNLNIVLSEAITIEDIRLIVNETQQKVLCSSMQKNKVEIDSSGYKIQVPESTCILQSTDLLTIEIDKGDKFPTDYPKKSDIPTDYAKRRDLLALYYKTHVDSSVSMIPNVISTASESSDLIGSVSIGGVSYYEFYCPRMSDYRFFVKNGEVAVGNKVYCMYGNMTTPTEWLNIKAVKTERIALKEDVPTIPTDYAKEEGGKLEVIEENIGDHDDNFETNTIFGRFARIVGMLSNIWDKVKTGIPTDYAKAGVTAKTLDDISIDTTALAKEQTLTTAKTDIIKAINEGGDSKWSKWVAQLFGNPEGLPAGYAELTETECGTMVDTLAGQMMHADEDGEVDYLYALQMGYPDHTFTSAEMATIKAARDEYWEEHPIEN